jgi:DNA adenine methylase
LRIRELAVHQPSLFEGARVQSLGTQLLKWIGNKQRFAAEIISYLPERFGTYYEPFLGSAAVLGTLAPPRAVGSDLLKPLIEIWQTLQSDPEKLLGWYRERWEEFQQDRVTTYDRVKAGFNQKANPADLLFLSRSCYGGVIRFRKDGYMSTPLGIHNPVSPESMRKRIHIWRERTAGTRFVCCDFEEAMERATDGDVIYCDPPYSHTQAILYGSQTFTLARMFSAIDRANGRGVRVALSIDGKKKSGTKECDIAIPDGLFKRKVLVNCGRSMLRRFQMEGETLEGEVVADRLLLTW